MDPVGDRIAKPCISLVQGYFFAFVDNTDNSLIPPDGNLLSRVRKGDRIVIILEMDVAIEPTIRSHLWKKEKSSSGRNNSFCFSSRSATPQV